MQNTLSVTRPIAGFNLRQWLIVDAVTCLVTGLALAGAAGLLARWFGLPESLLFYAGVVLFPCAALMAVAARSLAKPLVSLVIAGNFAWVAASMYVALAFEPTGLGLLFTLLQAAVVALLGLLEWRASR